MQYLHESQQPYGEGHQYIAGHCNRPEQLHGW